MTKARTRSVALTAQGPLVQQLRRLRRQSDYTQVEICPMIGVASPASLSDMERGSQPMPLGTAIRYAEAVGYELKIFPKEIRDETY